VKLRWEYPLVIAAALVVWEIGSRLAGEFVISPPLKVLTIIFHELHTASFYRHLSMSLFRILTALALAFITAVPFGLFLGLSRRADRLARPLIYLSYPIPKIVLLPVVMLMFGLGEVSKIAMLWLILSFQLLITTRDAARSVSKAARYSLLSLGGSRRHLFQHVILPSCLPSILTALRITTGTVVAVLFFVESIGTNWGMGFYIIDAWGRANIPHLFVGMVTLAGVGIALYETFDVFEHIFCKWNQL